MGLTSKVGLAAAAVATTAVLALLPAGAQAERAQAPAGPAPSVPDLLQVRGATAPTTRTGGPTRHVDVDTSLLKPGVARTVSIDVPGRDLQVALTPSTSGAAGWSAWEGTVAGDPEATATVVRKGDDVSAMVSTTDGAYRIRTADDGTQVVQKIDRMFPEAPSDAVAAPTAADPAVAPEAAPDASTSLDPGTAAPEAAGDVPTYPVIDVLVAYTPAARAAIGGTSAMTTEITQAVATTNTAYQNSGVNGRIRLAGTTELNENFDLSNQSLDEITGTSDGHVDTIHSLRNSTGADLVSVLVDDGSSCGLAWVLNSTTGATARSPYGFSTVDWSCAVDNFSFPHELGHNMGLDHDRYVEPTPTLFNYAVGYVNVAAGWRTIMAYNNQCADQTPSVYCDRLGRFSNPDQTYGGAPLGRPTSGSNPADNRLALNNTQAFVSSWRAKPAPFTSWSRFVTQQYKDFLGRTPSSSEASSATSTLNTGAKTPQGYIEGLLNGSFSTYYAPVARLYFAYFVRPPDKGGLDYWVNKYKAGMKLSAISSNFAASSEFTNKYGSLTNRQFVEKIYTNLFERTGDPSGINYWTGKLDRRESTRGQVMIGFSESSEFKRVRAEEISIVLLYRSLLGRGATSSEFSAQVARLQGGTTVQRLILEIVDSTEYGGRVVK